MRRIVTGDLGDSIRTGDSVMAVIGRAFPATIELSVFAMIIAVGLGIPLGLPGRAAPRPAHSTT